MEHYYTQNPQTPHNIKSISFNIKDMELEFYTDTSVFSKEKVDYGSKLLILSLPALSGEILDLGCGYGPIGISIARLNTKAQVTMVDINERAVELAVRNLERNQIKNAVALVSDGFQQINNQFNAIVTNPPIRAGKKVIYALFEQSKDFFFLAAACTWLYKKQGANLQLKN